jgi:hypothetical protein
MQDGISEAGQQAAAPPDPNRPGDTVAENVPRPTVGRIVHYTPSEDAGGKGQPYPAVVTHVWSDQVVNLSVANDGEFPFGRDDEHPTSVPRDDRGGPRTWRWPPRV